MASEKSENDGAKESKHLTLDEFLPVLLTRKLKAPVAAEALVDAVIGASFVEMSRFRVELAKRAPDTKKKLNQYITLVTVFAAKDKEFNYKLQQYAEWLKDKPSTII